MSLILCIETSTDVCSALLGNENEILLEKVCYEQQNHAAKLPLFIEEIINFVRTNALTIDAIAVSEGPGSYTGLRIGVSTAKGLCYAMNLPLIAIDTLQIMAQSATQQTEDDIILCPMIDARRMEVYAAMFDCNLTKISPTSPIIINENSFDKTLSSQKIMFCGNGSNKCRGVIESNNALFAENIMPLARNMIRIAQKKFISKEFVDVAYFEPFYLKEFIGTKPKNKVI